MRSPKGATGKLQRIGLHEKLADALAIGFEAPAGDLEVAVAAVWGELLGTDVGRHDNFFSLGGDSLSATSAVGRLADRADREIEPADLFRAPTVAGFAALLRGEVATDDGPLVQLRDGTGRPIFCVPGHGGDPFTFLELAKRLDGDRPIYALEFPPELRSEARDVEVAANRRTNELAHDFLDAVRDRQPDGPYDLVGFCFGGFIAHEMIATLEDDGQAISSAVYINSWQHTAHRYTVFGKMRRHLRDPLRAVRRAIARVQGKPLPGLYAGEFPGQRPISSPLVLVKPVDHLGADETWDHQMGWDEFATVAAVHEIPGAQREVFTAAHVEPLREILDTTVVTSTP